MIVEMLAASALAQAPVSQDAAPTAEAPPAPEERLICRNRSVVGSNREERICMTQQAWRDSRRRNRSNSLDSGARSGERGNIAITTQSPGGN